MNTASSKSSKKQKPFSFWSIGGTIFAMFFGAGNIVYPLALGRDFYAHPILASMFMSISSVFIPLLGLIAILLFSGNYRSFFYSIGRVPGKALLVLILLLIGPFGGIARAIAVSYATLHTLHIPAPSLPLFSLVSCALIYLFSCRLTHLIQWLGCVFSPLMFGSLLWIVFQGLRTDPHLVPESYIPASPLSTCVASFIHGFQTMDLLGSFFFCSIVILSMQQAIKEAHGEDFGALELHRLGKSIRATLAKGCFFACFLLIAIYLLFTICAARHAGVLLHEPVENILGRISHLLLGKYSIATGISVFVACLTTEIALVGISAEFVSKLPWKKPISYSFANIIVLIPTFFISILNFENISNILIPIIQLCYPSIITLTICNIAYKLYAFRYTKSMFYLSLTLTVITKLIR